MIYCNITLFRDKEGGLVVDYVGIAGTLKQAMNDYTVRDKKNYGNTDIAKVAYPKFQEKLKVCRDLLHEYDYSTFFGGNELTAGRTITGAVNFLMDQLVIAKRSADAPDADTEALRAEIIKIDEEIHKLMKKLGDADTVLFEYIQNTVNELHEQKSALERKMQAKARKRRTVDTAPLEKPMKHWNKLSIPEKHELAAVMLEAVYVSDENGIEVKFSI